MSCILALYFQPVTFFPAGGGQPGDQGQLNIAGTASLSVADTVLRRESDGTQRLYLLVARSDVQPLPAVGSAVTLELDFTRRYQLMRMHTALHLLCAALPFAVTGGAIRLDKSHLDFDTAGESIDKEALAGKLNALVAGNYPVTTYYLQAAEFAAKRAEVPSLVRTAAVNPPVDAAGNIRLVRIGTDNDQVDLQACGGTHVKHTGELEAITIKKIENKGRHNRRVRLAVA